MNVTNVEDERIASNSTSPYAKAVFFLIAVTWAILYEGCFGHEAGTYGIGGIYGFGRRRDDGRLS